MAGGPFLLEAGGELCAYMRGQEQLLDILCMVLTYTVVGPEHGETWKLQISKVEETYISSHIISIIWEQWGVNSTKGKICMIATTVQ